MQLISLVTSATGAAMEPSMNSGMAAAGHSGPDVSQQLIQVLGSLGVVLALVLVLAWVARRISRSRVSQTGGLRLLGGISLGSKERIVLVQVGEQQLLVGVAPGSLRTLHVLDSPLQDDHPEPPVFARRMSEALSGSRQGGKD